MHTVGLPFDGKCVSVTQVTTITLEMLTVAYDDVMMTNLKRMGRARDVQKRRHVVKFSKGKRFKEAPAVPILLLERVGTPGEVAAAEEYFESHQQR